MVQVIDQPARVHAAGNKPNLIDEFVVRVNSHTSEISLARRQSLSGWQNQGQTPEVDEYTVVLRGMLRVETREAVHDIRAGQAVIAHRSEWIRDSGPRPGGADYLAVCLPVSSFATVHRDHE